MDLGRRAILPVLVVFMLVDGWELIVDRSDGCTACCGLRDSVFRIPYFVATRDAGIESGHRRPFIIFR